MPSERNTFSWYSFVNTISNAVAVSACHIIRVVGQQQILQTTASNSFIPDAMWSSCWYREAASGSCYTLQPIGVVLDWQAFSTSIFVVVSMLKERITYKIYSLQGLPLFLADSHAAMFLADSDAYHCLSCVCITTGGSISAIRQLVCLI